MDRPSEQRVQPPKDPRPSCPYCVLPVAAAQAVERGDFQAHAECQARRERAGVYLTTCGGMVVGSGWLDPREAARVIEMAKVAKERGN